MRRVKQWLLVPAGAFGENPADRGDGAGDRSDRDRLRPKASAHAADVHEESNSMPMGKFTISRLWAVLIVAMLLGKTPQVADAGAVPKARGTSIDSPLPTPGMGWSTFNFFQARHSDKLMRQMGDAFIASGLRDAGYTILRIDGGWWGQFTGPRAGDKQDQCSRKGPFHISLRKIAPCSILSCFQFDGMERIICHWQGKGSHLLEVVATREIDVT
jgi:hypothetical protein